jgi:hypothetical protein
LYAVPARGTNVKNIIILCTVCSVLVAAMAVGMRMPGRTPERKMTVDMRETHPGIPSVGKVQVLNGCGAGGAAGVVADFLRSKKFDVKNIGNAPMSNYETTLVASRTRDMSIARMVAAALNTDAVFLMRTGDTMYNVTVYVGQDYKERAR